MAKFTQEYLVAYLDLLGAKNYIKNDSNDEYLNMVSDCYEYFIYSLKLTMPLSGINDYKFKIFSDNIIIAIPSSKNMQDDHHPIIALNRIQTAVCFFQRYLLEKDILIRGGVAFGQFYIDDILIWGKALIDSYYLENNVAEYPRVIIDKKVQEFEKLLIYDNSAFDFLSSFKIRTDFDGVCFFDYLNYPDDVKVRKLVDDSLDKISKRIESENDQHLLKKYIWHKNYLLYCINERKSHSLK